jgi:hypothetical protein
MNNSMNNNRTEVTKEAAILGVEELVKKYGKEGKLSLHIKPKKGMFGKWWLHFSLKAGDVEVVSNLPKIEMKKGEELVLEKFGIELLDLK